MHQLKCSYKGKAQAGFVILIPPHVTLLISWKLLVYFQNALYIWNRKRILYIIYMCTLLKVNLWCTAIDRKEDIIIFKN